MQYFNLHRHSPAKDLEETAIINIFPGQEIPGKYLCSIGIHPWHINQDRLKQDIDLLTIKSLAPPVLAVGECGLDRCCDVPFELQLKVFRTQVEIAETLGKPLIIHCVRAYPELISEKKAFRDSCPWIVHGFRGNAETASQLIKHGFYLSFGEALMKDRRLGKIFAAVPEDRYFLETDESSVSIREIYGKAASIRNADVEAIILRHRENALVLTRK
ncbi:MAG: TatD family hydrolase [Lentisphaerae bacterium]|nr:TatD family hydrolase [Lentisphaerota bacterium]